VQAFVEIVTEAAKKLATFFGFDPEDFAADTSGIEKNWASAEDEVDDYTESLKKAKKQMMGFDELNIIQNPDSGSSGADAGAGGMGDMGVYEYDFLKDLKTGKLDEVKEKVKDILKWVGLVGTAFAGWKIATGLATGITSIATALKAIQSLPIISFFGKIAFAIQAVAGGAATFGEAFVYVFQGVAGIFSGIVLGIVSIIGYVNNLIDMIKNGENVSNVLGASIAGLGGAGAAFLIAIGVGATVATGGIAALVVGIVAAVGIITAIVINHWDEIKAALSTAWTWLYGTVIKPVVDFFVGVATWFYSHVIKPIADFFAPIFELIFYYIGLVFSKVVEIVGGIVKAVGSIVKKVAEIVMKIVEIVVALGKAFYTYVITPVVDFFVSVAKLANQYIFKPIYDGLKWLVDKATAFFKPIITGVVNFFSDTFKGVINGVLWGIEWVINGFIKMLNGAIDLINKIPGVNITKVTELSIPRLAEGGIVSEGQMFIAREAGPELVGSIGRKTAVANNDQIVSGIESGVYRAMVAANANGNSGGTQTIRIINEIDGDVVGEKVIKYHNGRVMQTGVSPLLV
jgi:phage-related protein